MNRLKMTPKDNNYSVYCHTNKANGKRYFGITKQNPERRWQKGKGYAGTAFGIAVGKYGWDGFTHEVIISGLTKEVACNLEISLITAYRTQDREYGYNIAEGGQIPSCAPKYGIDHPNHRRVKMIDRNTGKVLKVFNSQSEAAKETGFCRKPITKACRGQIATYKGYVWEYADIDFEKPKHAGCGNYVHDKLQKKVRMTENGEHIFNSIKEAAEYVGVKSFTVSRYLTGSRMDKKRGWSYAS